MHEKRLIIDGSNLVFRDRSLGVSAKADYPRAARALTARIEAAAPAIPERVTVVFDGSADPAERAGSPIEILFPQAGGSADAVIERLVAKAERPEDITVVTSDTALRRVAEAANAHTMSCSGFLEVLDETRVRMTDRISRQKRGRPRTLGDAFPS